MKGKNNSSKHKWSISNLPIWLVCLLVAVVSVGLTLSLTGFFADDGANSTAKGTAQVDEKVRMYGEPVAKPGVGTDLQSATATETNPQLATTNKGLQPAMKTDQTGTTDVTQSIQPPTASTDTRKVGWTKEKKFYFVDNWYMNTRVNFTLDGIWARMGNIGEIFDTAKNIRHTSELSWYREWYKTAERVRKLGDQSLAKGHKISAGDAYLRASSYYLTSEVMLHTNPEDPRILEAYKKGSDYFLKGLQLLGEPVEVVRIPYEKTTFKGYFFRSSVAKGRAPILLVHQGFDAPVEQTLYIAEEANRRGYHCLLFEGAGQGLTIREQKIPFRPDWEKVVTPVVDYVLQRPDVDPHGVILMGISLGGGFATRAAAYEHRLRACIVNPGYVNIYEVFRDILNDTLINLFEQDPKEFNKKVSDMLSYDVGVRWGMNHGVWVFNGGTPAGLLQKLKEYNYEDDIKKIKCQMLIMDGTGEEWGKGQAKKLYDSLSCPKDYMLFREEDSAATHCQGGGPAIAAQRLFDWLDEHVK